MKHYITAPLVIFSACTLISCNSEDKVKSTPSPVPEINLEIDLQDSIGMKSFENYELDSSLSNILSSPDIFSSLSSNEEKYNSVKSIFEARIELQKREKIIGGARLPRFKTPKLKRITDGVKTSAFPTTGALLRGSKQSEASLQCTGTMISCDTFLTAAHCLEDSKVDPSTGEEVEYQNVDHTKYHVYLQHSGIYGVSEVSYQKDKYDFPNADVAVLKLSETPVGMFTNGFNSSSRITEGTSGEIVGFGRTGGLNSDYGIKRSGNITTGSCPATFISKNFVCWKFNQTNNQKPGENSNTCNGDSGGPLFTKDPNGGKRMISGVTSGGINGDCLSGDNSYDASVYEYRKWITSKTSNTVGRSVCGTGPHLGDNSVTVLAADGQLNSLNRRKLLDFKVNPGTSKVIVSMNGESDGTISNIDFDMLVAYNEQPKKGNAICERIETSQFASCQIDKPKEGKWYILVDRKKGSGDFQLVVTRFE